MGQHAEPSSRRSLVGVKTPRVLIVCDDAVMLRSLWRVVVWLRPQWDTTMALGPDETRDALDSKTFNAMLVNVDHCSSPGMRGLEYARAAHPNVRRIVHLHDARCAHLELNRADAVITTPMDPASFVGLLDQILESDKAAPPLEAKLA